MRGAWLRCLPVALGCLFLSPTAPSAPRVSTRAVPTLMLWAWERPTDLRHLDAGTGVAFLAQTIHLGDATVRVEPRRHPLRVSPATPLVAVTRIESRSDATASATSDGIRVVADRVAQSAAWPGVVAIQIDFDAKASERPLYRRLLEAVRTRIGPLTPLSMTALASWCAGDRWLEGLPVDEAVPMLFQMGQTDESYAAIGTSPSAAAPMCRGAIGVSLDEPTSIRADSRRVYVFNPGAWTPSHLAQARAVRP